MNSCEAFVVCVVEREENDGGGGGGGGGDCAVTVVMVVFGFYLGICEFWVKKIMRGIIKIMVN